MDHQANQTLKKDAAGSDLCLFGSQINLSSRPHSSQLKNKCRPVSACGLRPRRPYSAIPSLENQGKLANFINKSQRRPLSADNPYLSNNDYVDGNFIRVSSFENQRKHFPSRHSSSKDLTTNKGDSSHNVGDTFVLESSKMAKDLISEDLNRTWTKIEASDLGADSSDEIETLISENSEDHCLSEQSLGQKIKLMAEQSQQFNTATALPLTPGLTSKPPLPQSKFQNRNSLQDIDDSQPFTGTAPNTFQNSKSLNDIMPDGAYNGNDSNDLEIVKLQDLLDDEVECADDRSFIDNYHRESKYNSSSLCFADSPSESPGSASNILEKSENLEHAKTKNAINNSSNIITYDIETEYLTDLKFKRFFQHFDEEARKFPLPSFLETVEENSNNNVHIDGDSVNSSDTRGSIDSQIPENSSSNQRTPHADIMPITQDPSKSHSFHFNKDEKHQISKETESWMSSHGFSIDRGKPVLPVSNSYDQNIDNLSAGTAEINTNFETNEYDNSRSGTVQFDSRLPNSINMYEFDSTDVKEVTTSKLKAATMDPTVNSTYDDIVNILKVLEQEESLPRVVLNGSNNSTPELFNISTAAASSNSTSVNANTPPGNKLKEILVYLDEVDQNCNTALDTAKHRIQAVRDTARNTSQKSSVPRLDDLLNMSNVDLAHDVLTLKLQLEEKNNSVSILQQALNEQRDLNLRNSRNAEKELKTRLKEQKHELESVIARHQKFIDQLIAEKKDLNQKYESVVSELKTSEERHAKNLKAIEQRHGIELEKVKQMHAAAEKLRRERWIDTKTQKIKEMTVKGLEPELQRMTVRHQQELSDLRALHKKELEDLELRATRRSTQQMEQLRDQLLQEKEDALAKERELLRQRMDKQLQEEETSYQEQKKRLLEEVRREKDKLAEELERGRADLEEMKRNLIRECEKNVEKVKKECEENLDNINRKHQNELKMIRETLEMEKEAWMHNYKKEQAILLTQKEKEIREHMRNERDREIELVIEKLENESVKNKAEFEQAADNRLRRLREKYEAEVKDLEASEESLRNKYTETKRKLMEREDNVINLEATVRQLENELQESRKIADRLSAERAELKEVVRRELASQISSLEQELMRSKEELAETRVRYQVELASKTEEVAKLSLLKEKELHEVYQRVKVAIAKKEEMIQQLKTQHESALERCCHLECLLEQQRKDFLLK